MYKNSTEFIEKDKSFNLNPIDTIWSANRLKVFLECKRKYYYQYILKLKQRRDIKEFSEGLFIHRVLDNLFNKKSHFKDFKEMKDSLNIAMDKVYPDYSPKLNYIKLLWKKRLDGFLRKQIEYFKSGYESYKKGV